MPRLLVVEDEIQLRSVLADVLAEDGYEVMTVANGGEAMLAIESFRPDVVLLDLVMPGMDGWSFLAECQGTSAMRGVAVGIMSAATNAAGALPPDGIARLIHKPFDLDELLCVVREMADARAAANQPGRAPLVLAS